MERLEPGETLAVDDALVSADGRYRLLYQGDGNLVLYDVAGGCALWASDTPGTDPGRVVMQGDGNLVIYTASGQPVWASDTVGRPGSTLILGSDGDLVVIADGRPVWSARQPGDRGSDSRDVSPPPRPAPPAPTPRPSPPVPPDVHVSGGLSFHASDASARPRMSVTLPERGAFEFPAPYAAQAIRLTSPADGEIEPCGYSYWSNMNMHAGRGEMFAFVGCSGQPPLLLRIDKATLHVEAAGRLPYSHTTGEGLYWSTTDADTLYVPHGSRLERYDVRRQQASTVFDAAERFGADTYIWQCHSSYGAGAGLRHSMTVRRRETWEKICSAVYSEGDRRWFDFPPAGVLDECQIDKSGRWLLIKEGDDNRVVDLQSGSASTFTNAEGAVGHSDCGFGYVVGEDDRHPQPGAMRLFRFADGGACVGGTLVYYTPDPGWHTMARHVAHGNARAGAPDRQRVVLSSAHRNDKLPRANEIVTVPLDGSLACTVVCPTLVDLDAPGGGDDYRKLPKANVDAAGEWCVWTSNHGTSRLDAFAVRLPSA